MRVIVSLSGGMDSTTVLAKAIDEGNGIATAVGFCYGSKHNEFENKAAEDVANYYSIPYRLIDLAGVMAGFKSNLLKNGGDIPEGHYEQENMRLTVVPGRNSIFASILLGLAESLDAQKVYLGIHAGDHFIYPDCRPSWLQAMRDVYREATEGMVEPVAPFLNDTKVEILQWGLQHSVPYRLTRTCYQNQRTACGKCGSCRERLAAFKANNVEDPIEYEFRHPNPSNREE